MSIDEAPKPVALSRSFGHAPSIDQALAVARTWAVPSLILALALFLRVYNFQTMGWVPDTYDRIMATQRLLAGDFPISEIYPPALSLIFAPFFALFSPTLATMQFVIIGCGVLLVAVAYIAAVRLTGDRVVAAFLAFALSADASYVYASRDGMFDIIVALLLSLCVFVLPVLQKYGTAGFVAYGFALSLLINIRPTNAACLPALLVYGLYLREKSLSLGSIRRYAISREVVTVLGALLVLSAAYALMTGWLERVGNGSYGAGGASPTLAGYGDHFVSYAFIVVRGTIGLVLLGPLAMAGIRRLWRTNRSLSLMFLYFIVVWPLVHAPFNFVSLRYMLSAGLFFYFLAALGPGELFRMAARTKATRRAAIHIYSALSLALTAALFVTSSGFMVTRWSVLAGQSDEGMFAEMRPAFERLSDDSLVVTATARVMHRANDRIEYLDLVDLTVDHLDRGEGVAALQFVISDALSESRPVYYLASQWESENLDGRGDRYLNYLQRVRETYTLTEVTRNPTLSMGKYTWILYRIEEPTQSYNVTQ